MIIGNLTMLIYIFASLTTVLNRQTLLHMRYPSPLLLPEVKGKVMKR